MLTFGPFARPARAEPANTRPNILVLIADDLGWADLHTGATSEGNGASYHQTPHIDRLAEQGMSFTSFYACPNCAPSRAALMTGQYAVRNGVYNVGSLARGKGRLQPAHQEGQHIRHEAVTVAETLKTAGYTTAHAAKFHVSNHEEITQFDGFDFNYGGGAKGDGAPKGYFAVKDADGKWKFKNMGPEMDPFATPYTADYIEQNLKPDANGNDPSTLAGTPKHLTDATADAVVDFLTRHVGSPAERDKPFFINVGFNAVHGALRPRRDLEAKYAKLKSSDPHHDNVRYAALLDGEDQAIGRVLRFLDDHALTDRTVVVFISDNGGAVNSTRNDPLRGFKGMFYEGGLRVPLIVRWPGVVHPGAVRDTMLSEVDLYPTFAEIAGATLPEPSDHPLDGQSFAAVLKGEAQTIHRKPIYWHFPGYLDTRAYPSSTIIKETSDGQRYKLFYSYEDSHYELYDLTHDLGEKHDLLLGGKTDPPALSIANDLHDDLCAWLARNRPLWATDPKTGQPTPPPVPIEHAMKSGNAITRQMTVPGQGGGDD
jgi:arylsulfatase A-like enzyme